VAEQGMVRLSDGWFALATKFQLRPGSVRLGFACASLKRTTSRMNWARSLEVRLGVA